MTDTQARAAAVFTERSERARDAYDKIVGILNTEHDKLAAAAEQSEEFAATAGYQTAGDVIFNDILPLFGNRADATLAKLEHVNLLLLGMLNALHAATQAAQAYGSFNGGHTYYLHRTALAPFAIQQMHEAFKYAHAKLQEVLNEAV